jgi:Kef-type K+ transport system membrane component KefB
MFGLAMLLGGATVGLGIARWLRLPVIPLLLLSGLLLAVAGLLPEPALLQDALVLGLTVLVFVAGVELNPQRVGAQRRAALRVGVAQFSVLLLLGVGAALALGFAIAESLYLGLALTASSTLIVVRILQRRQQLFEPFGRLVIGVLLLQDLLVILLIPVITRAHEGAVAALQGLLAALVLVGLAWVFLRWITPVLITRLDLDNEMLLLTTLALLFVFLGLADLLGLPLVAGAFLAGVALSPFPVSGMLRGQLTSLSDFFLALFFTALGGLLVIPSAVALLQSLALALLVIVATPPLVTVVAERAGLSARPAIESGLLLAQTSEFSLVVALQALALGHVSQELFTIVALVTVTTMILTPILATDRMTWRLMAFHPLRQRTRMQAPMEDHIVLLGCGDNGWPLLETLLGSGHDVLVVDDDPAVIERLHEGDIPCIRGDGSDREVIRSANALRAKVIISTMRRVADNEGLLEFVRGVPTMIRVFEPADAERIRALGGLPIVYSRAAAEDFLQWLDEAESVGIANERRTQSRGRAK